MKIDIEKLKRQIEFFKDALEKETDQGSIRWHKGVIEAYESIAKGYFEEK